MPSRRGFLSGVATGSVVASAGCLDAVEGLVDDDLPAYANWLHDPAAVLPVERYAVATVDVGAVRARRDDLPEAARDSLDRADRLAESVSLGDLDRLTALGYGVPDAGTAGLTLTAAGAFDADAVRREIGVRDSRLVTDEGSRDGFQLYAYEPSLFAELREHQGPDQPTPPDLTFGLGVSETALVGGVVLSPNARGLAAVRAAVDAHADATEEIVADRYVRDLLVVAGDRELAVVCSRATVTDLAPRVDDERMRELLADARGLGAGYALADERLRVALAGDPAYLADPDRVRSVVEDATDGATGDGTTVDRVGVARGGRVVYADLSVPLATIAAVADGVPVTEPLGTATG